MNTLMYLGLAIGLAGVAGVRTYFPLIVIGLITRFSETLGYRPPLTLFASVPLLIILCGFAAYELLSVRVMGSADEPVLINIGIRVIGGAVLFSGIFKGFGIIGGLIAGGFLAALSYLIMVRLREEYKNIFKAKNNQDVAAGIEESAAVAGTVLVLLIPWISFVIWGAVILSLLKKLKEHNRSRLPDKARSWR